MKTQYLVAAAWLALSAAPPVLAASTHTITIENPSGDRVRFFSVTNAKVIGFKATNATKFDVTVELPDTGVCNPYVRVTMGNGERIEGRVAICRNQGFTIRDQ